MSDRDNHAWESIDKEPEREGDYIVRGPNVSGRIGGRYGCWRWDGKIWWAEDGTEIAWGNQLSDAEWIPIPS